MANGIRFTPSFPEIVNLRADPYEKAPHESMMYFRWFGDLLWLFVPLQQKLQEFLMTIPQYPFQEGSNLNAAANINYSTPKAAQALKQLQSMTEGITVPTD